MRVSNATNAPDHALSEPGHRQRAFWLSALSKHENEHDKAESHIGRHRTCYLHGGDRVAAIASQAFDRRRFATARCSVRHRAGVSRVAVPATACREYSDAGTGYTISELRFTPDYKKALVELIHADTNRRPGWKFVLFADDFGGYHGEAQQPFYTPGTANRPPIHLTVTLPLQ